MTSPKPLFLSDSYLGYKLHEPAMRIRIKFIATVILPMIIWGIFPLGVMQGDRSFIRKLLVVGAAIWIWVICNMELDHCPHCDAELERFRGNGWGVNRGPTESCSNCGGDVEGRGRTLM